MRVIFYFTRQKFVFFSLNTIYILPYLLDHAVAANIILSRSYHSIISSRGGGIFLCFSCIFLFPWPKCSLTICKDGCWWSSIQYRSKSVHVYLWICWRTQSGQVGTFIYELDKLVDCKGFHLESFLKSVLLCFVKIPFRFGTLGGHQGQPRCMGTRKEQCCDVMFANLDSRSSHPTELSFPSTPFRY